MLYSNKSSSSTEFQTSLSEVEISSLLIAVAGNESITIMLIGITDYQLRDPTQLQVPVHKILSNFHTNEGSAGVSLSQLPYLNAVLHEGLRLCPSIPDGMRREVPKGGALIAGHVLPQGTVVSIPQWASYEATTNLHSPTSFAPERWLEGSARSQYSKDRKNGFQPFSLGPHNCPGRSLAYREICLILAKLVWSFDLKVPKGFALPERETQRTYWFWDKQTTHVRLSCASQSKEDL